MQLIGSFFRAQPRALCSWLFFFTMSNCFSQTVKDSGNFVIQGNVFSSADTSAIGSAHVYIQGTAVGTVTSSTGEFALKIPVRFSHAPITVSCIGYNTESVPLDSLRPENINIALEPLSYLLQEIEINSKREDSSRYLIDQAVHALRFNYPRKNHLLEGFYRSTSMVDTTYTRLIEAAIRVQETGYHRDAWDDESLTMVKNRIKILEIRKSDDFRNKDFLSKALLLLFGERNDLYSAFDCNYARTLGHSSNHFMSIRNLEKYETEHLGEVEWDGAKAQMISLSNRNPGHFQWDEITFIINNADYAFVRIEIKRSANPARKDILPAWLIEGKYFFKADVSYRKIDKKYYPVLIHTVSNDYGASSTVNVNGFVKKQFADQIFLLTNIYGEGFSRIKWKETEDRDIDLYKVDRPYNQQFWERYNTVKMNPLKRNPKELEKNLPLAEQFKRLKNE
jgi:hypothetical protein